VLPSRLRPTFFALQLAMVVGACGALGGQAAFNATFPPLTNPAIGATPVSLVDQTGLVTGMDIVPAPVSSPGVTAEAGDANALRATWLGTDCDGRITLVLGETGAGYGLTVHVNPGVAGGLGCKAIEVVRAVAIRFRSPLDPARITISQQYP
jgi:hypothetical protein